MAGIDATQDRVEVYQHNLARLSPVGGEGIIGETTELLSAFIGLDCRNCECSAPVVAVTKDA